MIRKTQNSKIWIFGSCESPSKVNSSTKVWFPSPIDVYPCLPVIRSRVDVFWMFDFTSFINKRNVNKCTLGTICFQLLPTMCQLASECIFTSTNLYSFLSPAFLAWSTWLSEYHSLYSFLTTPDKVIYILLNYCENMLQVLSLFWFHFFISRNILYLQDSAV